MLFSICNHNFICRDTKQPINTVFLQQITRATSVITRVTVFCLWFILNGFSAAIAQQDSLSVKPQAATDSVKRPVLDSLQIDSIKKANRQQFLADSFAIYLKIDSNRKLKPVSEMFSPGLSFMDALTSSLTKPKSVFTGGALRKTKDPLALTIAISLLIFTALLNIFFSADLRSVIQSFYNKQVFSHLDFEGGLISSWAFIGLFILFSFTAGLILYQYAQYKDFYYDMSDLQLFVSFSVITGVLLAVKFMMLKFIGFVFDVNNLVSQYISVLNLTYFNVTFVLLAAAVCFSLLARPFVPLLLNLTGAIIMVIFAWQYLRNSVGIISNIRFRKFYLFIYLCALEICPVLILIKSLSS